MHDKNEWKRFWYNHLETWVTKFKMQNWNLNNNIIHIIKREGPTSYLTVFGNGNLDRRSSFFGEWIHWLSLRRPGELSKKRHAGCTLRPMNYSRSLQIMPFKTSRPSRPVTQGSCAWICSRLLFQSASLPAAEPETIPRRPLGKWIPKNFTRFHFPFSPKKRDWCKRIPPLGGAQVAHLNKMSKPKE